MLHSSSYIKLRGAAIETREKKKKKKQDLQNSTPLYISILRLEEGNATSPDSNLVY